MIVCKFGGTTTTQSSCLKSIKNIIKLDDRKVFVFSAIGKINKNDEKLTDILISYTKTKNKNLIIKIKQKLNYLCNLTGEKININYYINKYIKKFNNDNDSEYFISRGEYLTALIMSKYLNVKFIPAEKLIYLNNGDICYKKIKNKLNYYLKKYKKIVTCGFYGIDNKKIKLFERGGGDISGAIIAHSVNAVCYENFTDQNGIKEVNPQIVKNAKTIKYISFSDCSVFLSCDANVLHKEVCNILKDGDTIIKVKNILSPNKNFTTIDKRSHNCIFVCFKRLNDYCQIVVKTNSMDKLRCFYDSINYISKKYVYICTDVVHVNKMIKQIYFNIVK